MVPRILSPRTIGDVVAEDVQPSPGDRILDIGCGPAKIVSALDPSIDYVGFDPSDAYIAAAREAFGSRAKLSVNRIETFSLDEPGSFDIVLALGVLHHLSDEAADRLLAVAARALKPGGRFIARDPGFTVGQNWIARMLARMDRGRMVRFPEPHEALARRHFDDVELRVTHDRMRVPYTHFTMFCRAPASKARASDAAAPVPSARSGSR